MKQINRKILSIVLILIGIIFLSYISACTNELSQDNEEIQESVQVYLTMPRALGTDIQALNWEVTAKNEKEEIIKGTKNGNYYFFESLTDGKYTFTAIGKTNDVECFSGSTTTTISTDKENIITIVVNPIKTGTSNGVMEITVELSEEILSVITNDTTVNLYYGEQIPVDKKYTDGDESLVFTVSNLTSGYYTVYFEFDTQSITNKYVPINNRISVISNCTTKVTYTKDEYELANEKTIYYVNNNSNGNIDSSTGLTINNPIDITTLLYDKEVLDSGSEVILLDDVSLENVNYDSNNSFTLNSFGNVPKTLTVIEDENNIIYLESVKMKNIILKGTLSLSNCEILGNTTLNYKESNNTEATNLDINKTASVVLDSEFIPVMNVYCYLSGNWKNGDRVFDVSKLTDAQRIEAMSRIGISSQDRVVGSVINNEGIYLTDGSDCSVITWNITDTEDDTYLSDIYSLKNETIDEEDNIATFIPESGQSVAFNGTKTFILASDTNVYDIDNPGTAFLQSVSTPIYADSEYLYTIAYDNVNSKYKISKYPIQGGDPIDWVSLPLKPDVFAVDGDNIYVEYRASDQEGYFNMLLKYDVNDIENPLSSVILDDCGTVTGMYIDGDELCILALDYEEYYLSDYPRSRGGVFKFNKSDLSSVDSWNNDGSKTRFRDTLAVSKDSYKTSFLFPIKIVGIYKRKLIIVDDGVSCIDDDIYGNMNRIVLFDLDGATFEYVFTTNTFKNEFSYTEGSTVDDSTSHYRYTGCFYY